MLHENAGQNTGDITMYRTCVAMGVAYSPQQVTPFNCSRLNRLPPDHFVESEPLTSCLMTRSLEIALVLLPPDEVLLFKQYVRFVLVLRIDTDKMTILY